MLNLVRLKFQLTQIEWQADGQFLGSFNPEDVTFQWAWDNPEMSEQLKRDSRAIKAIGERFGLEYLVAGGGCFSIPGPDFVAYLCGIGLKATDSTLSAWPSKGGIVSWPVR